MLRYRQLYFLKRFKYSFYWFTLMAKKMGVSIVLADVWGFVAWVTGVIVSLAVGFGLVNNILAVPYVPAIVTQIAGWIVIVLSLLGLLLAIIDKFVG